MRLDKLVWVNSFLPGSTTAIVRANGKHLATIYRFQNNTYSIYAKSIYAKSTAQHVDALTAQAILFELTREGNNAAK